MYKSLTIIPFIFLSACSVGTKSCDPKRSASVFESKIMKINKIIDLNNIKKVVLKSYGEPMLTRYETNNRVLLEGVENRSVGGYHTDECTAKETIKNIKNAKPSLGYKTTVKGSTLFIETTGERGYIHHRNAFSSIKIRLPQQIEYKYIHLPLING